MMLRWVLLVCAGLLLGACGDDPNTTSDAATGDLQAQAVATGFEFPTQLFVGDDQWFLAQLSGAENDATGSILRIDPDDLDAQPLVLLEDLDKPTGVAVFAGELWVMERQRLSRGPLDGTNREVVVDDMAFNSRSQGTLTVDGDRLLFNTSGSLRRLDPANTNPQDSSGVLWSIDSEGEVSAIASGFKHAYAQTRSADGTLWATEMTDGQFDGRPAEDEIVAIEEGADHGWPSCVGNNRPVTERDGTEDSCASVPNSHALFDVSATPTSIVVAPWDDALLVVTLWNEGTVVTIPVAPGAVPHSGTVVYQGVDRPQHLAIDGDRLLLVDFNGGQILELAPSG